MISVNKKYSNPLFFEKVMKRKYPFLLPFKREDETMKNFYLRMIFYISKLEKEYNFKYPNIPLFNPATFYKFLQILDRLKSLPLSNYEDGPYNYIIVKMETHNRLIIQKNNDGGIFYAKFSKVTGMTIEKKYQLSEFPTPQEIYHLFIGEIIFNIQLFHGEERLLDIDLN